MVGLRILPRAQCVTAEVAGAFASIPVANVSDSMERLYGAPATLRHWHDGTPLCGPAVTVRVPSGDNLMVHKALDIAEPGDVVVVDAGGDVSNAIIGEMMVAHARYRRLGGIVIHGAIRDARAIGADSFPVFALAANHRGPYKHGPGEINVPIVLGTLVIEPGDLILGDDDGILSVPFASADTVLAKAQAKMRHEADHIEKLRSGQANRSWIDRSIEALRN